MAVEHWNQPGEGKSWLALHLGGEFIPGVPTVSVKQTRGLDVQKPKGADKAKITDKGAEPATVTIRIVLASKADFEGFQKVAPLLRPNKPGTKITPLDVQHPTCQLAEVHTLVIKDLTFNAPDAHRLEVEIEAIEWVAQPTANGGLGGAKGTGASCAEIMGKLQQAVQVENGLAAQLEYSQAAHGGFGNDTELLLQYSQAKKQTAYYESLLNKCAGGGSNKTPSQSALQQAA